VVLSDDEIVRLSDEWLPEKAITLHFSALCDEFASAIPVVAESIEDLSRKAYDMFHIFQVSKLVKSTRWYLLKPLGHCANLSDMRNNILRPSCKLRLIHSRHILKGEKYSRAQNVKEYTTGQLEPGIVRIKIWG